MNVEELSNAELEVKFNNVKNNLAFGLEFMALSKETKLRKAKVLADQYRAEFSSLTDDDIVNFVLSFGHETFITLTEHIESEVKRFKDSQPF